MTVYDPYFGKVMGLRSDLKHAIGAGSVESVTSIIAEACAIKNYENIPELCEIVADADDFLNSVDYEEESVI